MIFYPISTQDFLKNQQDFNNKIQEGFITDSFSGFLFNIILLAIIPAVGEELFSEEFYKTYALVYLKK